MSALIEEEIALHMKEGGGHIILKCNQLVDPDIIALLYKASRAGVKIECIVRGICSLRPGIPGVSDTITVRSIVGELLEHARVYWFRHGGKEKMYVGSADMMTRNLNGRIEVLAPVLDPDIRDNILEQIVKAQLADNVHAWVLAGDGTYTKVVPEKGLHLTTHRLRSAGICIFLRSTTANAGCRSAEAVTGIFKILRQPAYLKCARCCRVRRNRPGRPLCSPGAVLFGLSGDLCNGYDAA